MSNRAPKRGRGSSAVVIELGSDWVKAIHVERGGGLSLAGVELHHLEPGQLLTPARLKEIVGKVRRGSVPVYGCLPRQFATVRMIDLPSTDPGEIADMVEIQVGKVTPYSREEIVFDYRIVGAGREGYTKVIVVIVQRSVLRGRFSALEEAGIPLVTMSVGTEGILNWIRRVYPAGGSRAGVAVLDVDASFSDFVVIYEDRLVFSRSILVGGAALHVGDGDARERLAREALNALQAVGAETNGVQVEHVLLTGAGGNVEGLKPFLTERLSLPVDTADCLQIFRKTPSRLPLHQAPYRDLSLTPLVGIGIDPDRLEFNLVPDSVTLRKNLVRRARELTMLGCLALTVLLSLSMWGTMRYFFKRRQLATLRAQVANGADTVFAIDQKRRLIEVVNRRGDLSASVVNLLADVQRRLPPPATITIDTLEFDGEHALLTLGGTGQSRAAIGALVQELEQSPLFMDVQEGGATVLEGGRYRFRILCRVEVPHVG